MGAELGEGLAAVGDSDKDNKEAVDEACTALASCVELRDDRSRVDVSDSSTVEDCDD